MRSAPYNCKNFVIISGSGAVGISHMDGACVEEGVQTMVQRVQELAVGYPEGRLELQLIGGFTYNRGNYGEELFSSIMRELRSIMIHLLPRVRPVALRPWTVLSRPAFHFSSQT